MYPKSGKDPMACNQFIYGFSRLGRLAVALLGVVFSTAFSPIPTAASNHQQWISFSGAPEGTPAEFSIDPGETNPEQTTIEFRIYGFWLEEKEGDDSNLYYEIAVPGIGFFGQPGAPKLPVIWADLALPDGVPEVSMATPEIVDTEIFTDFVVWPQPIPEADHEEGEPEQFLRDDEIYDSEGFFPLERGTRTAPVSGQLGLIRGSRVGIYPMRWDPAAQRMEVVSHGVWRFTHPGGDLQPSEPMTRRRFFLAEERFLNWDAVSELWPSNDHRYESRYLVIHPEEYADELQPFIDLKWTQGYRVSTMSLETIGSTCDDIRTAIADWYEATPTYEDHYCLLVGEHGDIPLCVGPETKYTDGVPTDDLYGSVDGDDLNEEVFIGRLSVDLASDLTTQVEKIIQYQTGSVDGWDRGGAALVAHKENAPDKYEGAHEDVRTATYSNAPDFTTFYGSEGATDEDVSNGINQGFGVVAYRGHGNSGAWT
ncbi:MAG: hypothetical protein GF355_00905, partial [Candidatus Eisenbacteria bacterium]|nr:hypothetical protein [Candidatus Eisenbacteria bacterium]